LFEEKRLVLLENYQLLDKKTINWLNEKKDFLDLTLVIYHQTTLPEAFLKSIPKIDKVEEYKLPKIVWSFLESFYPGNIKNSIQLFHKVIKNEPEEFVFSLLAKQIRDLFWVKVDPKTISYPLWRKRKLERQALRFTKEKLVETITELAEIDVIAKTSNETLANLVDFTILNLLE